MPYEHPCVRPVYEQKKYIYIMWKILNWCHGLTVAMVSQLVLLGSVKNTL